jgi:membrane-associated phospholipid phosphatase
MSLAVVATGNHFVLDVVAGAALAVGAWYLVPRLATIIRDQFSSDDQKRWLPSTAGS